MDLNIRTESTVLKMTLESGLVLNLQIPKPIQLTIANGMYWGGIGGNIQRQADLMLLFNAEAEARQAGDQAVRDDLLPLIYAAMVL